MIKKIIDPVFRTTIHLIVESDGEKAKKAVYKIMGDKSVLELNFDWPVGAKSIWNSRCKNYVIWLRRKKDVGHLVHEIVHITQHVLEPRGIYLKECDETYAYYQEFLFNECMKAMKDK
jgi:hypothetical protein